MRSNKLLYARESFVAIVKNAVSGFFWGLGFAVAFVLVVYIVDETGITKKSKPKRVAEKVVSPDIKKILLSVESVKTFQDRVIVAVKVLNENAIDIESAKVSVTVSSENQPFDECLDYDVDFIAGESKNINIYCGSRWKNLGSIKLSATAKVEL